MTNQAQGRKKSNFPAKTSILSGAYFDYFVSGVNYKISWTDLLAAMGVTGSITQAGDPTDTPVLDIQGAVNYIRNFKNGPGVKFSVNAQNGITGEHNFTVDTTGAAIVQNPTATQPTIRSITGGTGITATESGGVIRIDATAGGASSQTVVVTQMSDFPAAVAGVRTLAADTDYLVVNSLTTTDRFDVNAGNIVIRASDSTVITLTYTGSGTMFTGADASFRFEKISVSAPNGRVWSLTDSTGAAVFQMVDSRITSCDKIGFIGGTNFGGVQIAASVIQDATTDGIEFSGTIHNFLALANLVEISGGSFLNLGTAVFTNFGVNELFITLDAGTYFLSGQTGSANIAAAGLGTAIGVRSSGAGTPLLNITPDDARWFFTLNTAIRDSRVDALLSMQGNATLTNIVTVNTPVLVAGTWVVEKTSQMSGTTGGRITYNAVKDARLPVTASVSVEPASGVNINISAYFAIDGVVVANSKRSGTASATSPTSITLPWQETFSNAEYIEIFVENNSGTTDILVSSATFRVN